MAIIFNGGIYAVGDYVISFNNRTGEVILLSSDVIAALGFTPENVANKATDFTTVNNTLYPTIQAVVNYIASLPPGGVSSFNTRTGAVVLLSADVVSALGYTPANAALFVPYTGATTNLNLGTNSITGSIGTFNTGLIVGDVNANAVAAVFRNSNALGIGATIQGGSTAADGNYALKISAYDNSNILFVFKDLIDTYVGISTRNYYRLFSASGAVNEKDFRMQIRATAWNVDLYTDAGAFLKNLINVSPNGTLQAADSLSATNDVAAGGNVYSSGTNKYMSPGLNGVVKYFDISANALNIAPPATITNGNTQTYQNKTGTLPVIVGTSNNTNISATGLLYTYSVISNGFYAIAYSGYYNTVPATACTIDASYTDPNGVVRSISGTMPTATAQVVATINVYAKAGTFITITLNQAVANPFNADVYIRINSLS